MIPVYPRLKVMFFKFLFIHKIFFCTNLSLMICVTWQNFARVKWRQKVVKILHIFVFVLFWNLVFMCKASQPRIYVDLLRFQSRVKDPVHIIILMESIIPFFIHSFHVLMFLDLFMNKKNQRITCNIQDKNNHHFLFSYIYIKSSNPLPQIYESLNVWFHCWSEEYSNN